MDENEFRRVAGGYDPQHCHFAKAILMRCAGCSRSQRVLIAEREAVHCMSPAGHARCGTLLPMMREKALFALGLAHAEVQLPHGKQVKVECGGLGALAQLLGHEAPPDIDSLLQAVETICDTPDAIPWDEIVRGINRYSLRRRSGQGGPDHP
jgi:hypothetical protein